MPGHTGSPRAEETEETPSILQGRYQAPLRIDGPQDVKSALDPEQIDLPARPQPLVELSLLLAREQIDLASAARVVEQDMALAAAVLKSVNSPLYGLSVRVDSVQQALTYLGVRQIAAITFEMGLRAAFPPGPEMLAIWDRAARRGFIMSRLAQPLGLEPWAAHSAGLFEECGKAVLFRHAQAHYRAMMRAATDDAELCQLEQVGFGIGHDALGAAMCEAWGLAPAAVACVRLHVQARAPQGWPAHLPQPGLLGLSVIAHAMLHTPDQVAEVVGRVAVPAQFDPAQALAAVRKVEDALAAGEDTRP